MIFWVVDASVLLANEDNTDETHSAARQFLEGPQATFTLDLAWYEVANVAITSWRDPAAAGRLRNRVDAFAANNRIIHADNRLIEAAVAIALAHSVSIYDAAYVAAASGVGAQLVSCDVRDLVSKGLALTPAEALAQQAPEEEG